MSQDTQYNELSEFESLNTLLRFGAKLIKYSGKLDEIPAEDIPVKSDDLNCDINDLIIALQEPGNLEEGLLYGGYISQLTEITLLIRLFRFYGISFTEALACICDNPRGYMNALSEVFREMKTDRELSIENDIIISFRRFKVSFTEASQVLNLKNSIIRKVWKNILKERQRYYLDMLRRERESLGGSTHGGRTYHHLSRVERGYIMYARLQGASQKSIAEVLGRNPGTISREVRRCDPEAYGPLASYQYNEAMADYRRKRQKCGMKSKICIKNSQGKLVSAIIRDNVLNKKFSPEQVSQGVLKNSDIYVSTATIYKWIYDGLIYGVSKDNLRRKGKKYKSFYNYRKNI